jgi:hypothetical protein
MNTIEIKTLYLILFTLITLWELTWKTIGGWKAARNNQPLWFIFILITNTLGILPIIYLIINKEQKKTTTKKKRKKKITSKKK